MQYDKNFNRNLAGGKRRNRGITKYGPDKCKTLTERLIAESKALEAYHKRIKK